jgi:hypothetical protein
MSIDESDLAVALDRLDDERLQMEGGLFHGDQWIPAAHRHGSRLSIDLQTMSPDLTERELQLYRLGKIEAYGEILEELGDELLDGEFELS